MFKNSLHLLSKIFLTTSFIILIPFMESASAISVSREVVHTLTVKNPTAKIRPTNGSGYMLLQNTGEKPIKLLKFSSEIADETQLHEVIKENDVMKMRQQEDKILQPGATLELKSMSWHLMFLDLDYDEIKKAQQKGFFNMTIQYKNTDETFFKRRKLTFPVKILTP